MKYQIIYADPPWKTGYFKQKKDGLKSRKLPYDVMSDEEIKNWTTTLLVINNKSR